MPAYVVLYRFTDVGRKNIKGSVRRAQEVRSENEKRGFKVLAHYWTQGRYDLVTIVEAPNEEAMMGGLFSIAEAGNVSSETMRAFTDDEMQKMLA
ncbi:MAG TPA: GYD domain-containing protein [Dehalococcoidia bacterium]